MGRCIDPIKELERRKKISLSLKGNKRAKGYKPTDEQFERKSKGLIKAHKRKEFGFQNGQTPWNKDKTGIFSEETLKIMGLKKKGYHPKSEFQKGHIPWNKNLTIEDPRVEVWSDKSIATQKRLYAEGKLIPWNKNQKTGFLSKTPKLTKKKMSEGQKRTYQNGRVSYFKGKYGKLHPNWKGENCKKRQERSDPAYVNWVARVKRRDNNICQLKDENCSGYNIVHHIKGWSKYPKLRYEINNGITLCQFHHPLKRKDETKFIPIFQKLVKQKK